MKTINKPFSKSLDGKKWMCRKCTKETMQETRQQTAKEIFEDFEIIKWTFNDLTWIKYDKIKRKYLEVKK